MGKRWSGRWVVVGMFAGAAAVSLVAASVVGCAGPRPDDLGLNGGRLLDCPGSPNCVNSQADEGQDAHVAPLAFEGEPAQAWADALAVAKALPRCAVVEEREGYAWLEVSSAVLGFVDDLELALDAAASCVHVRSASRVGYSDLGVNRRRVEALRAAFTRRRAQL